MIKLKSLLIILFNNGLTVTVLFQQEIVINVLFQ